MDEEVPEIWVTKFDEDHAQKFRLQLHAATKGDPNRPVIVYIDSYGGQADSLAKMIETLDETPNPIITACLGKAMSCGAMLLAHGDVRFLGPNSRIMIHEVSSGAGGNVQDIKDDVKEIVRLNEHLIGLLAKDCGYKNYEELRKVIKDQDGRERYLVGEDAVKFGIVDIIGMPKITVKATYEISQQPDKEPLVTREKRQHGKTSRKKSETKKR